MKIIIENGELRITGTVSEQRAWNLVREDLTGLGCHAGGEIAEAAKTALMALEETTKLAGIEWAKAPQRGSQAAM